MFLGHFSIFLLDAIKSLVKNASIIHFKLVERRPRNTRFFKNKVKFVDFRKKWFVLPYSKSFSENTNHIDTKLHPFPGKQKYNLSLIHI